MMQQQPEQKKVKNYDFDHLSRERDFSRIYRETSPSKMRMVEPFGEMKGMSKYKPHNIFDSLILEREATRIKVDSNSVRNFPENIEKFFWTHQGKHEQDEWCCLCQLDDGNYAFYLASCDYTGFDCQGDMTLYVSSSLEHIIMYAMTDRHYCAYRGEAKIPVDPKTGKDLIRVDAHRESNNDRKQDYREKKQSGEVDDEGEREGEETALERQKRKKRERRRRQRLCDREKRKEKRRENDERKRMEERERKERARVEKRV